MPRNQQLLIIGFLFLIIFIPLLLFLIGQRMQAEKLPTISYDPKGLSFAHNTTLTQSPPPASTPNPRDVLGLATQSPTPPPETQPSFYGPTLSFKVALEGRPANQQQSKIFIGIAQGMPTENPSYLLSYTVDVPPSGSYSGVSALGLLPGTTYTAYLKGPVQLVKAVPFNMSLNGTSLNSDQPISLTTGDLNQDNYIDNSDLQIEQNLLGTTPKSSNWNPNADFNQDKVVNTLDLLLIRKNQNLVGDSGKWYSAPSTASTSARLDPIESERAQLNTTPSVGGAEPSPSINPNGSTNGHWMWVPDLGN